ncbi:MAG: AMP-binding protein [Deltaproteobacteria bacterium]|nr:AMP-binding protein [Deltaproteobacteria bacterium]
MSASLMDFSQPKGAYTANLLSSLRMNLARDPDLPALIHPGGQFTWAEMWQRTNRLGNALLDLGLQKGDRLALYLLGNRFEFNEAFVAGIKTGVVRTPVNFNLKEHELAYQLNNCAAKAILTSPELLPLVQAVRAQVPSLAHVIVTGGDSPDVLDYEALLAGASADEIAAGVQPGDVDMILYTSGTTGNPKGAVRGFAEDYHTGITVCVDWGVRSGDRQLVVAPQYHAGPCAWYLATLVSGGTLVIVPRFDPELVLTAIQEHQVNWLMMVPVMSDRLLSLPGEVLDRFDLGSIRLLISGGAPLHTPTKLRIKRFFEHAELNEFYGSTELGVSTTLRDVDQLRKERCVGKPLQDVELKLVDPQGQPVPRGEVGALYSRGLCGFRGYWDDEPGTREAFLDHDWATVGDLARQDPEGYYYIVDRAKDMIITGGVNVYPAEIEGAILGLAGVADVAVIGVPDEQWGEAVKAVVVPRPGAELGEAEVIAFCKAHLAKFKVPKSVDLVAAIPRNPSGKILKKDLRRPYWENQAAQVC